MKSDDETNVTEIELTSDGLIRVFGASREVLELLEELELGDRNLNARMRYLRGEAASAADSSITVADQQKAEV